MVRSILSVLAGLIVIIVASFGIEAAANPLLMRLGALPSQGPMNFPAWLFTFSYTCLCVIAGGYVTARLAAHHPVRHALILGLLQSALTVPAMLAFPEKAHLWGWILSMIVVIPAAWCGGWIFARTQRRK